MFLLLLVILFLTGCVTTKREAYDTAETVKEIIGKDGAGMVLTPAGEFMMGSREGYDNEKPQHRVYLDYFYIDKYEVTVGQYRKYCEATDRSMPEAPRWGWIDSHPMVNASWEDASAYARYYEKRLPSEAGWEKACRAENETKYSYGDDESRLKEYAWYGEDYYKSSASCNPMGPNTGRSRVLRGGSWSNASGCCRSAFRNWVVPTNKLDYFGFRCAVSASP